MATTDKALKEGQLHVKQNKFGKKWKRCYVMLYPDSPFGVARLEIYDSKDGTLAGEKFQTRKAADRKVIRLAECVHVALAPAESSHKDNMATFIIVTSEKTMLLSGERAACEEWVLTLSEAAFPGNTNGGKPCKESADSIALEMAVNSIYFSREEVSEFWVTVQRTEAAERCSLRGSYILRAEDDCLILKDPETKENLYSWPYKLLRRYGRDKVMFSFEAGRRCASGPGNFTFETSQGHDIFQKVESSIRAQQGPENRLSASYLDTEAPSDMYQSSNSEMLGLAARKEAEEKMYKGRVLPNVPAIKVAQPQHLLDPVMTGKPNTPPRSPVSHHSADSEHLSVYSEPKDSVKGVKHHFDTLYSDPVDSVCGKEKLVSPLYSDLYEQVGYEVVGGSASSKTVIGISSVPPGSEEHIYDEPEGIVRSTKTKPPQLYSEVQMEAAAWKKQSNDDEKLGYEYPYNPKNDDYSVPHFQGQRGQPRTRTGPKPIPAPKPQGIILPKPPGKESEKTPVLQSNSNNNNGNIEALYSQVIKPGNKCPKSQPQPASTLQSQSAPPLLPMNQLQPAPPLLPINQPQTAPPLLPINQPQTAPPLLPINQLQPAPPLLPINQLQPAPPLLPINQLQPAPPLLPINQLQPAPPLPPIKKLRSPSPIPSTNLPQSTLSNSTMNKEQSAQPRPLPPAKPQPASTLQLQPAPPLLLINQLQPAPPLPPINKPQSPLPIPSTNSPQSAPSNSTMNKEQSAQPRPLPPAKPQPTQPIPAKTLPIPATTLPITVLEVSKTLPSGPSPGQTVKSPSLSESSNGMDLQPVTKKDISVIYEDMGFL